MGIGDWGLGVRDWGLGLRVGIEVASLWIAVLDFDLGLAMIHLRFSIYDI